MSNLAEMKQRAHHCDAQHDLSGAIEAWHHVLRAEPDCTQSRYFLVRLLLEDSEFDAAERICKNIGDIQLDAWLLSAQSHFFQSRYQLEQAIECARKACETDFNAPHAVYAMHGCLLLIGDEVGARDLLNSVAGRFLDHSELETERACSADVAPETQLARLDTVVERFDGCRTARFARITALNVLYDDDRLDEEYGWLSTRCCQNAEVSALGALIDLKREDYASALRQSTRALELNSYCMLAHFVSFQLSLSLGDREHASLTLEQVRHWTKGSIHEHTLIPQMLIAIGAHDIGRDHLLRLHEQGLKSPEVLLHLSRQDVSQGNLESAAVWLDEADALYPGHFDVVIERARVALEQGRFALAGEFIRELEMCEAAEEIRLRISVADENCVETIAKAYRAHLERYPSFDFVWGTLLRYFLENEQTEGVTWLLGHPREVPVHVRHAVKAYQSTLAFDLVEARVQLEAFLNSRTTDVRWTWCWELILESLDEPELSDWLPRLAQAAKDDGL